MQIPNPFRLLTNRLSAVTWTLLGRRRLRRGNVRGALGAFERALRRGPRRFGALMNLAEAHLCAREQLEARRYLGLAREADPRRYELRVAGLLARWGFDLEAVGRAPGAGRPEPVVQAASRVGRIVTASQLPYGDCRDVDEYARFRVMPPITADEVAGTDWDSVLGDLLDE